MKFLTEINIEPLADLIEHKHRIITMGSCFAENLSEYFIADKFSVMGNPFGVLYNPISIFNVLKCIAENKVFSRDDLVQHMDEWHSFYFHSDFSHHDPDVCLKRINAVLKETGDFIKKADWMILTYGSAFTYQYKKNGFTVSNCHKIPAKEFEKNLLPPDRVEETIVDTIDTLRDLNPGLRFIFTVSPVRHWSDGAVENQLSKSTLLVALHSVLKKYNSAFYFPSYEIMMDELRDYRFYKQDLLHPNKTAVEYIRDKFCVAAMSGQCRSALEDMRRLASAMAHRPRNRQSPGHRKFLGQQLELLKRYKEKYPYVDFSNEIEFFSRGGNS
ncbi:MAG: GSCFA domain-containing protein [bacterium]|nr:GSCFA domain-containing protein [bacterium]